MADYVLLEFPKLISRKISVIQKSWKNKNFHEINLEGIVFKKFVDFTEFSLE